MDRAEPLFWVDEPKYGCSQPVRVGDLLRVKDFGYGWKEEGKVVLVLGGDRPDLHKVRSRVPRRSLSSR